MLSGCVTPVIPLPPPKIDRIDLELSASGKEIVLRGKADPNLSGAWIFAVNSNARQGVMREAEADGSFVMDPLPAADGDRINLWAAPTYFEATGDVSCGKVDLASKKLLKCN